MEINIDELEDLTKIEELIKSYRERVNESLSRKSEINKQLESVKRELTRIQISLRSVDEELEADRNNARLLEKRQIQLARQKAQEEERKRLAEEFEEASKEFDELTATAFWREFAYSFQIEGAKRLAVAKRGILGDKRGLGKTLTSIIWMDMLQAKKILVIAINDVAPQFAAEIHHWAPHRPLIPLYGMPPAQRAIMYPALKDQDNFVGIINYEAWRRDKSVIDDILRVGFDTLIIDEAHKMKEWQKLTARGISQIAFRPNHCTKCGTIDTHLGDWSKNGLLDFKPMDGQSLRIYRNMYCKGCGADFDYLDSTTKNVLPMTGTPILNKPQEMFALLHICYPELFPSESDFLQDFCTNFTGRWQFRTGGEESLAKIMREFFVQRTREDAGIEVPPPAIITHKIEKDEGKYEKQYKAEREIAKYSTLILDDMGNNYDFFYMLEIITRLRQVTVWPENVKLNIKDPETKKVIETITVNLGESQKLDAVTDLLKDLVEEDERTIVFSQFKEPLYELQRRIGTENAVVATGDQSDYQRAAVLKDFDLKTYIDDPQRKPTWKVALCTYKAFSTGLNLNAARHMILIDSEWNPGMEDQAIGRIDRLNSTDQATVHKFQVKDSIDEFMETLMEQKRNMVGGLEGAMSAADLFKELKDFLGG